MTTGAKQTTLIPDDAYESGAPEGTLGAEEELWLADPGTMKLASGAQKILAKAPEGHLSGELIDCEIEANTGVHADAAGSSRTSSRGGGISSPRRRNSGGCSG